jgi:hypothetical protein
VFVHVASSMILCLAGAGGRSATLVQVSCFRSAGKNVSLVCVLIIGYFFPNARSKVELFFSAVCSGEGCRWSTGEHLTLLTVLI